MSGLLPSGANRRGRAHGGGIAALIDGLYIRRALRDGLPHPVSATALVEDYVEHQLELLKRSA